MFIGFIDPQSPETQHGALLALGYMVGRYMSKKKAAALGDSEHSMGPQMSVTSQEDDELVAMATKSIGMPFFLLHNKFLRLDGFNLLTRPPAPHAGSFLDSSSALLAVAACTALGEVGRNGPLLIPDDGPGFTKLSATDNLLARIPSGKESTKVTADYATGSGRCLVVCTCVYVNDAADLKPRDL